MRKKLFSAIVTFLFALGALTGATFAWWDTLTKTENPVITIGMGATLEVVVVLDIPAGKTLVPTGVLMGPNDIDEVVLTYNVKLDKELVSATPLTVTSSNVLIGGSATHAGLVNIGIVAAEANVNNTNVLVTVTVSLNMPADQATYDAIKNAVISFTLTFTATGA